MRHRWSYGAGRWRCEICTKLTIARSVSAKLKRQPCLGPKQALSVRDMASKGHRIIATKAPPHFVFCARCGGFAMRRARILSKTCPGVPTLNGRLALANIAKGRRPWEHRADATHHDDVQPTFAWDEGHQTWMSRDGGAVDGPAENEIQAERDVAEEMSLVPTCGIKRGQPSPEGGEADDSERGDAKRAAATMVTAADRHAKRRTPQGHANATSRDAEDATGASDDHGHRDRGGVSAEGIDIRDENGRDPRLAGCSLHAVATAVSDTMNKRSTGREHPYGEGRWAVFNAATGRLVIAHLDAIDAERDWLDKFGARDCDPIRHEDDERLAPALRRRKGGRRRRRWVTRL